MATTLSHPRKITSKGQVTLPAAWRKRTRASAVVMRERAGVLELRPARKTTRGDVIIFDAKRDNGGRGIPAEEFIRILRSIKD